jgi:hypothetical protein
MKSEDRAWREQQAQDQRDWRAEQNSIYKRTAEEQMAGRAGAGKADAFKPEDTQPGGRLAGTAAGMLETNEDRLADYQKYRKTGEIDLEKYGQEVPNRGEENVVAGSKEVPQALKEEFKLKAKMLSQLEESYYLKGSYDDATKGRATAWKTAMGQAAFDKPEVAGKAGQAVAVGEGKPLQNIEGGQQYNQYTGTGATTPLGKSQIAENQAKAGESNARASELGQLGKKYGKEMEKIDAEIKGGMFSKNSSEKLTSWVNSANATIKSLDESPKGSTPEEQAAWKEQRATAVALRAKALKMQNEALDLKESPPAPKPEAAKPGAAKRGVWDPVAGRIVWK